MRTVFMGTPAFAVPVLEALDRATAVQVVGVYTPPDRPRGRGREPEATPVKAAALEMGLPVFQPASLRSARVQAEFSELHPDLVVVAAYGRLLPPEVLTLPPHGCLNLHPSLLPKYRGPAPVAGAILDGLEATGVTLMLLDEGMDTGPIVAQQQVDLAGTETADTLTAGLFRLGAELLLDKLGPWTSGQLRAVPQDHDQASLTTKLERSDGLADWNLPARELELRQRAFTPWPGLFTQWQGKTLRLLEVVAVEPPLHDAGFLAGEPGLVQGLAREDAPVGIVTAQGTLALKRVQMEGRRAATAAEFLNGYPDLIGSRL